MAPAPTPTPRFREERGPSGPVDARWMYDVGEAVRPVIPADGCVDLIVWLRSAGVVEAVVHPPSPRAHDAFVDSDECVFGVRLRPGYGGPLLERSAHVSLVAQERLRRGAGVDQLEALAHDVLDQVGRPPALVREFLHFAAESRGTARLGDARSVFGGERRLQRAARRWLGLPPKAFMRIERARAARDAIRSGRPAADVAADFGFADQAHLTRDFRELLGVTPRAVRPVGILQDLGAGNR